MNNEKINSKIKLSNNSSFVILIFVILKLRNIGRSTFRRSKFWPPPLERHGKDSKSWKMGSTRTERTTDGKAKNCVRNTSFKKEFFASDCNWRRKMDILWKSSARPNRFGKKTMLCVWWDQKGVMYYIYLKFWMFIWTKFTKN